jgi:Leu/Phe-tRNA-protein transferase
MTLKSAPTLLRQLLVLATPLIIHLGAAQASQGESCAALFEFNTSAPTPQSILGAATPVGNGGLLTSQLPYSGALDSAMQSKGLVFGWVPVFVVDSIEAARAHSIVGPKFRDGSYNQRLNGFYFIAPRATPLAQVDRAKAKEVFEAVSRQAEMVWFDSAGEVHSVSREIVQEKFNPSTIQITESSYYPDSVLFLQPAWLKPPVRALIQYADTQSGSTFKNIRRRARNMIKEGFYLKTNGDFAQSLHLTQLKARSTPNRYTDLRIEETMKLYRQGLAHSIEVWSPSHELVAGIIAIKKGGLVKIDTVFTREGYNIDYVKFADMAFIEWMHLQGIDWTDSGSIVTGYSESLNARYVPLDHYLQLLKELPSDVDVPTDFSYLAHILEPR